MSIGSETNGGVRNVSVCDLSLDGTDNGLRIKSDASRGGLVQGIYYTDVCIRDSRHPLVFDSYYSSATGTLIPGLSRHRRSTTSTCWARAASTPSGAGTRRIRSASR